MRKHVSTSRYMYQITPGACIAVVITAYGKSFHKYLGTVQISRYIPRQS